MKTTNKLKTLFCALLLIGGLSIFAQNQPVQPTIGSSTYKNAIGLRAGGTSGLTYKHIFGNSTAFEGIVSTWPYTVGITGLFEKYNPTNTEGLNFYYGAGGHVNLGSPYSQPYYYRYYRYRDGRYYAYDYVYDYNGASAGIDGILGIEYKFRPIPFALSADIKPFIEMNNFGRTFVAIDPSIGLKVTF